MREVKTLILLFLMAILAGCVDRPPEEFSQIDAIKNVTPSKLNSIRQEALKETAGSIGAQAGLAWRSRQINDVLKKQSRQLDLIFNFDAMLLDHNVLPPVLAEGRNTLNLSNSETIRLSDHYYQIVYPARFVTAAPTWRDYLWMNYKKPDIPDVTLIPKNATERRVWNKYLRLGWNDGVRQANEIFSANLGRLNRDFSGIILYRKLYAQRIVSAPFVSRADLGVTGGGDVMNVNDRVLRITAMSELDPISKHWRPVLTTDKKVKSASSKSCELRSLMEKLPAEK